MVSTDPKDSSIILFGATGYTGKLILQYLASHSGGPLSSSPTFSLALAGRSVERLQNAASEVGLHDIPVFKVDVLNDAEVRGVIKDYKVVITSVGPFWKYGKVLAGACAELGVHYADTTGETYFIRHIVEQFDYVATKTGAILIPSAGLDSVPSDMSAFLGVRTLQKLCGPNARAAKSTSAIKYTGFSLSGGTALTMTDTFGGVVPAWALARARNPYSLSPMPGPRLPRMSFIYKLPYLNIVGGIFFMAPVNASYVRRSWGLYQAQAAESAKPSEEPYGEQFKYTEFQQTSNVISAWALSFFLVMGVTLLKIAPIRWFAKSFIFNSPGQGPDESQAEKGSLEITNITTSEGSPEQVVKSVIKGRGEAGYFLTSVMTSEIALGLLPVNRAKLTDLGRKGGVLTSMSALGMELIERLKESGRFEFESGLLEVEESRKRR